MMCELLAILYENSQFSDKHAEQLPQSVDDSASYAKMYVHENIYLAVNGAEQELFTFDNDRYSITFSGNIHNLSKLKDTLMSEGYQFETSLTSEVIAYLFLKKNVSCLNDLRGMFTVLIWDQHKSTLYGGRDHFGMGELYYSVYDEKTVVSTQLKYLTDSSLKMNYTAVQHYLSYQYVPQPMTIKDGVQELPPGTYFTKKINEPIMVHRYFHAQLTPTLTEHSHRISHIKDTLITSIATHIKDDSLLGSFLSGGIDSTLITAIAKEYYPNLKTFSIGFDVEGFSELKEAKQTADLLGLENISYVITPEALVSELPNIMAHLAEPFADPSCIPLYFIAREAKKSVNTVLSGEGADELFGGYKLYREFLALNIFNVFPQSINNMLAKIALKLPNGTKGKNFLHRGTTPLHERYIGQIKIFEEHEKHVLFKKHNATFTSQEIIRTLYDEVTHDHPTQQMQYIDLHTWLPGDIVFKAIQMTKAHGLTLRIPFLDKEVFKTAQKVPVKDKINKGTTKLILRDAFKGMVPNHILNRPKLGFPVPIIQWLKTDLHSWARQLIDASQTDHIFYKSYVHHILDIHLKHQKSNYGRKIWTILSFMLWHQVHYE